MPKVKKSIDGKVKKQSMTVNDVLHKKVDKIEEKEESMANLNKLKQVTGQTEAPVYKKTTISQVLGDKGYDAFGTLDLDEYTNKLNKMDKYDLNVHATKVNVFPHDNRQRLIKELITAFNMHVVKFRVPENNTKPKTPSSKAVQSILNQAK